MFFFLLDFFGGFGGEKTVFFFFLFVFVFFLDLF